MTHIQLFSIFYNNIYLEMAISKLVSIGIREELIFAVPLDKRPAEPQLLDSIRESDGTSFIDIGLSLATGFSVIGTSIGFKLTWGPIIWGLTAALVGFVLGLLIRLYIEIVLKKRRHERKNKTANVILIVDCPETQAELVENILWEHFAEGVAKVK